MRAARAAAGLALAAPGPDLAEASLAAWLDAVAARAGAPGAGPAAAHAGFLLVSPHGLSRRAALWAALGAAGARPLGRHPLPGWPRLETAVRVVRRDAAALARALAFEAAWGRHFPAGAGEAWALGPLALRRARAAKERLRSAFPSLEVPLGPPGAAWAALHAFHLPDAGAEEGEARRLLAALPARAGGA